MNSTNVYLIQYSAVLIIAFILVYLSIPKIVKYAVKYNLLDNPDQRKVHKTAIPALGGIGVLCGSIPALLVLVINTKSIETIVFTSGILILFLVGVIDDIIQISPLKRLILQLMIATITVSIGIRFNHLFGIFGIYELPLPFIFLINIIIITGIINAFNLIDGINGLAAGLGLISLSVLGFLLLKNGQTHYALVAFSFSLSYLAFLRYNLKPTFIFMGDNGSLVLGYLISFLSLKLLSGLQPNYSISNNQLLNVIIAISFIPVVDALRVFYGRIKKKKSPFSADKTHIHHLLIQKGFSHKKSSIYLYAFHVTIIAMSFLSYFIILEFSLLLITIVYASLCFWLTRTDSKEKLESKKIIVTN